MRKKVQRCEEDISAVTYIPLERMSVPFCASSHQDWNSAPSALQHAQTTMPNHINWQEKQTNKKPYWGTDRLGANAAVRSVQGSSPIHEVPPVLVYSLFRVCHEEPEAKKQTKWWSCWSNFLLGKQWVQGLGQIQQSHYNPFRSQITHFQVFSIILPLLLLQGSGISRCSSNYSSAQREWQRGNDDFQMFTSRENLNNFMGQRNQNTYLA